MLDGLQICLSGMTLYYAPRAYVTKFITQIWFYVEVESILSIIIFWYSSNLQEIFQLIHNLAHIIVLDFDILCASPKSSRNLQYINIWENLCKNSKFSKTLHIHLQIIIWIAKKMIGSQLIPFWIQNHWTSKEETNSRICCIIKGYWSCFLISCPSNNEYDHILRPVGSKNLSNGFSKDSNFKGKIAKIILELLG